ncbi:MAG TPA: DUF2167 domain-containing protein [Telluria sp.]|nr:DUF2167 domain-containing protein [Telluria sp.]
MQRLLLAVLLALTLGSPFHARAQESSAPQMSSEQFLATLAFKTGKITLPGNIATLDLPPSFRYLDPKDSEKLLVDGWGNPPGGEPPLGMIIPADVDPLTAEGWGVVITYDKDGHVKDDDADSINYTDLLKEMQESMAASNEERKKLGYGAMNLVGWAEAPSYDKANHKLYWAKELDNEGQKEHGLNYNIRVLGREGVLVLNAVAGMSQIAKVKSEMRGVTAFTDFTPGNRYADFNESTDKVAEYGLAGLVAGGIAAKLGFFGKLFALLIAFKKLIIVGAIALGAAIVKFFRRDKAAE